MIEASKLNGGSFDGCFRYTSELLRALLDLWREGLRGWEIDIYSGNRIVSLDSIEPLLTAKQPLDRSIRQIIRSAVLIRLGLGKTLMKLLPERWIERLKRADSRIGLTSQLKDLHQGKPIDTSAYDLVHLTLPQAYRLILPQSRSSLLVTVLDCTHRLFPENHLEINVQYSEQGILFATERNARFIAISNSTRHDFSALYGVEEDRISVSYLASDPQRFQKTCDPDSQRRIELRYGLSGKAYLLTLSTLEPRKNLLNTAKAFLSFAKAHPSVDIALVIAGKRGWKFEELMSDPVASSEQIIFTGFVPDQDLPILYSNALALLFVSHYEGFGLPALEAMSCGTPVIFGNTGALPEVVGEGGLPADPKDLDDIADRIGELVLNADLRQELEKKALQRAQLFSWRRTAQETLEAYKQTLQDSARHRP